MIVDVAQWLMFSVAPIMIGHCSSDFVESHEECFNLAFDRVAPMPTFVTLLTPQVPSQVQHIFSNICLTLRFNIFIYRQHSLSSVFTAPSHVTVMGYCDKQPNLIAAGCNSGQVI